VARVMAVRAKGVIPPRWRSSGMTVELLLPGRRPRDAYGPRPSRQSGGRGGACAAAALKLWASIRSPRGGRRGVGPRRPGRGAGGRWGGSGGGGRGGAFVAGRGAGRAGRCFLGRGGGVHRVRRFTTRSWHRTGWTRIPPPARGWRTGTPGRAVGPDRRPPNPS